MFDSIQKPTQYCLQDAYGPQEDPGLRGEEEEGGGRGGVVERPPPQSGGQDPVSRCGMDGGQTRTDGQYLGHYFTVSRPLFHRL